MRSNRIVLIAALVALVAKLYCAAMTIGTNDTVFFYGFGKMINQHGLEWTYRHVPIFNHTPLIGSMRWSCAAYSPMSGVWLKIG